MHTKTLAQRTLDLIEQDKMGQDDPQLNFFLQITDDLKTKSKAVPSYPSAVSFIN